jgi:hypothetical protein
MEASGLECEIYVVAFEISFSHFFMHTTQFLYLKVFTFFPVVGICSKVCYSVRLLGGSSIDVRLCTG